MVRPFTELGTFVSFKGPCSSFPVGKTVSMLISPPISLSLFSNEAHKETRFPIVLGFFSHLQSLLIFESGCQSSSGSRTTLIFLPWLQNKFADVFVKQSTLHFLPSQPGKSEVIWLDPNGMQGSKQRRCNQVIWLRFPPPRHLDYQVKIQQGLILVIIAFSGGKKGNEKIINCEYELLWWV